MFWKRRTPPLVYATIQVQVSCFINELITSLMSSNTIKPRPRAVEQEHMNPPGKRQRNVQHTLYCTLYNLMSTEPTGQFQYSLSEV